MPGATKHCVFGICSSDSREGLGTYDPSIKFFKFPKPCLPFRKSGCSRYWGGTKGLRYPPDLCHSFIKDHLNECELCRLCDRWVFECKRQRQDGRLETIADVKKDMYICSKHFPEGTEAVDVLLHLPCESGSSLDVNMRRKSGDLDDGEGTESEDTQEASEVEQRPASPPPRKESRHHSTRGHSELIDKLRRELQDLMEGRNPEYLRKCAQLEKDMDRRFQLNKLYRDHAIELVDKEYVEEIKAARVEFEEKDVNLKASLVQFLEDKRRIIEADHQATMEQGIDVTDAKLPTRNLRRRALDSTPAQEKRRGKISTAPCQISHLLDERDIEDDLRAIARAKRTASLGVNGIQTLGPFPSVNPSDIKIEDGKLLYEKKWFHRGQTVYVEGKHMAKFPAVISNIGNESVHVKRTIDSSKVRIGISQLIKGSVTIKRKAS